MNEVTRIEAEDLAEMPPELAPSVAAAAATPAAPRRARLIWMLSLPLLLLAAGLYLWLTSGKTVSTDNAAVGAHVVSIAPEVGGRIVDVAVTDNQVVAPGALLFRIDPAPYRIALMESEAAVGNARLQINQMSSDYSAKQADTAEKSSDVELATENFRRQKQLLDRGFTTRAGYDSARAALSAAQAARSSAAATAQSARAILATGAGGGHPQVLAALAQRDKAALNLARTELRAPIGGRIAQADRLEPGNMAVTALPMVTIVDDRKMWIDANFKETQLAKIRPGQTATVWIDAIPDHQFRAHVLSIGAGTGAQFSLLPAQNATGNWVKVTQRVPVRLVLDEQPDRPLVAGWSAHLTVRVAN